MPQLPPPGSIVPWPVITSAAALDAQPSTATIPMVATLFFMVHLRWGVCPATLSAAVCPSSRRAVVMRRLRARCGALVPLNRSPRAVAAVAAVRAVAAVAAVRAVAPVTAVTAVRTVAAVAAVWCVAGVRHVLREHHLLAVRLAAQRLRRLGRIQPGHRLDRLAGLLPAEKIQRRLPQ